VSTSGDAGAASPSPAQPAAKETGETVTETVTLWRYQPPRAPRRDQKDARRGGKPGQRGEKREGARDGGRDGARGHGPKDKGGKRPPKDQKPRTFSSGPRTRKEADPDSPFAVLANLKKD
jgi:ATP-dependent RNA helicase SUPV3L1/SUV3